MNDIKNDADILWALRTEFQKGSGVREHAHNNYYHLLYVISGACKFKMDEEIYELHEGMHMLACPGILHALPEITSDSSLFAYEIKFVVFDPVLKRALKKMSGVAKTDDFSKLLIGDIFKSAYYGAGATSSKARRHYLCTFLYHIVAPYEEVPDNESVYLNDVDNGLGASDISQATAAAARYIEENYLEEISLHKISETTGYNKNYICTVFKKDTGINIGEYINYVRIRKAAELLSYSDRDLAHIAKLSGFMDVSHFNKTFKKIVGIPPGQYRRSFSADMLITGDESLSQIKAFEIPVWAGRKSPKKE